MNKETIAEIIDQKLINDIMAYAYTRTQGYVEAQDLCSDIILEIFQSLRKGNSVKKVKSYVWTIATNVYADFCAGRKRDDASLIYDADEILNSIAAEPESEDDSEYLKWVLAQIANLSESYREVMISIYLDGKSIENIASEQNTSVNAIRQRLFSARQEIRSEVKNMDKIKKPLYLENIEFSLIGVGNPSWGGPRATLQRQISKQLV